VLTERQRFRNWLRCQREDHGLVDITVCANLPTRTPLDDDLEMDELAFGEVPEEIFAALNGMNAAIARGEVTPLTGI
jgi:hypothetical protein